MITIIYLLKLQIPHNFFAHKIQTKHNLMRWKPFSIAHNHFWVLSSLIIAVAHSVFLNENFSTIYTLVEEPSYI